MDLHKARDFLDNHLAFLDDDQHQIIQDLVELQDKMRSSNSCIGNQSGPKFTELPKEEQERIVHDELRSIAVARMELLTNN